MHIEVISGIQVIMLLIRVIDPSRIDVYLAMTTS